MNEIAALAADFGYAAGPGAHKVQADTEAAGKVRAQLGTGLPKGKAGAVVFAGRGVAAVANTAGIDPGELAGQMAARAASEGAAIITQEHQ